MNSEQQVQSIPESTDSTIPVEESANQIVEEVPPTQSQTIEEQTTLSSDQNPTSVQQADGSYVTTIGAVKVNQDQIQQEQPKPKIDFKKLGSDIPINKADEDINLIGKRIGSLQGIEGCTELQVLCLRNNLIPKIECLDQSVKLVELELYDNKLTKIEGLESLVNLKILDLSYNNIKKIEGLETLKKIEKLYLLSNKIKIIEGLDFPLLTMLELGSNKISKLQNFNNLPSIQQLYLGKNRIQAIENLEPLKDSLTTLALTANCIKQIGTGVETLTNLEELYVAENSLTKIDGVEKLTQLTTLDLSMNKIDKLEGISSLQNLIELWLNVNQIENFGDLDVLKLNPTIETVYLSSNPVARFPSYKQKLIEVLPNIQQIDATLLTVNYNVKK